MKTLEYLPQVILQSLWSKYCCFYFIGEEIKDLEIQLFKYQSWALDPLNLISQIMCLRHGNS